MDFFVDENLSLQASIAGLAKVVANGKHKVTSALNKLKKYGYFRRIREIDPKTGRVIDWIYEFSDQPHPEWITYDEEIDEAPVAEVEEPEQTREEQVNEEDAETPQSDLPHLAEPHLENEPQLNIYKSSTYKSNTIDRCYYYAADAEKKAEAAETRKLVKEQIDSNILILDGYASWGEVHEVVSIITDIYISNADTIRINGSDMKMSMVKKQFYKLTFNHLIYFFERLHNYAREITNMHSYIITSLYNCTQTYETHRSVDDTIY